MTCFSPQASLCAGATSAKSMLTSSPHIQPVPHHGELEGVGVPGDKFCAAAWADNTYNLPDADRA